MVRPHTSRSLFLLLLLVLAPTLLGSVIWMRRTEVSIATSGEECVARAYRALRMEGFSTSKSLNNGVWGGKGDRWTLVTCDFAPSAMTVNIVSAAPQGQGEAHQIDHEKVSVHMREASTTSTVPPPGVGWDVKADSHRGQNGQRFSYFCGAHGRPGNVWGTGIYTDDSSVCTAAVHHGLISFESGGTVGIEIRPGQSSYRGSWGHNVLSQSYGAFHGSFMFLQ